ncbi:MAG TPA: glycosyltransferase family 2 protein [Mucilaginibacter sp.]
MREEPLVSIALCTYNGAKFIRKQLDSILHQTHKNLEIVVVDDCSTDDTYEIISDYSSKDDRIRCYKNEVNQGYNKNFEKAISLTTGNYIAISDQDDIWLPEKIASLLENINDNWLIFSNSCYINERDERIREERTLVMGLDPASVNYKSLLLTNYVTGHTTLFKREFISYFLPFPDKGFYDWWMGFIALYHHKIAFLDKVLTKYRIHDASVIQKRNNSGQGKREVIKTIDQTLFIFAEYKRLNSEDAAFIGGLRDAYRLNFSQKKSWPLVSIILKNYKELFYDHKARQGLSLLNFAFKYARKARKYA